MEIKYYSESKAAEWLALSPKTLSRWRWAGRGPKYRKFGGTVRYAIEDLIAYSERCCVAEFMVGDTNPPQPNPLLAHNTNSGK
jgi:hypothetical protein